MSAISWRAIGLIVAVVATVAIIIAAVVVNGRSDDTDTAETPPATAESPVSDGGGSSEESDGGGEVLGGPDEGLEEGSAEDKEASQRQAVSAATIWVDHTLEPDAWREKAKPLFTDRAWPSYALPAPQRIGPTEVTGDPEALAVSVETAEYQVPTDAGALEVGLVKEGDAWLVSYIDKTLASPSSDDVGVGEGDPMLGATDGTDRGEVRDIDASELDRSNTLETAEAFRRAFENETADAGPRVDAMRAVSDPTMAAQLLQVGAGFFDGGGSTRLDITQEYELGADTPYAAVTAYDGEAVPMYTMRLSFEASEADPSIGTWSVVSADWNNMVPPEGEVSPLSQSGRNQLRETAAKATVPVVEQSVGEDEKDRKKALKEVLADPEKAAALGAPEPEENVRIASRGATRAVFVTPKDSKDVWVKVDATAAETAQSGWSGTPATTTLFVQMVQKDGEFVANDVYSQADFDEVLNGASGAKKEG